MLRAFIYEIIPGTPEGYMIPGRITDAYSSERALFRYGVWPKVPKNGRLHRVEVYNAERIYGEPVKVYEARLGVPK